MAIMRLGLRFFFSADIHRMRAARVKDATRRRVDQIRRAARHGFQFWLIQLDIGYGS